MPSAFQFPNQQNLVAGAIPSNSVPYIYTALGFQQITSLATSTALTVPTGAKFAQVNVAGTGGVSWRDDGTAPTASIGMQVATSTTFNYTGSLSAIRFILSSLSPVLNISYYK